MAEPAGALAKDIRHNLGMEFPAALQDQEARSVNSKMTDRLKISSFIGGRLARMVRQTILGRMSLRIVSDFRQSLDIGIWEQANYLRAVLALESPVWGRRVRANGARKLGDRPSEFNSVWVLDRRSARVFDVRGPEEFTTELNPG